MAFGHADSDAVFKEIERTLEEVDIRAVRVDRVEHNDDIDNRIIEEIERADLVLADLSYARPSVYFEAGFAQRCVPVIYTVRSDHFRPRVDDPNGNLRVHFDLQMKNIIPWNTPKDEGFRKRLRARVLKVVAPLRADKITREQAKERIAGFEAKSRQEQRDILQAIMRKHFGRFLKYRVVELIENSDQSKDFVPLIALNRFSGAMVGTKCEGSVFRFVFFQVVPSITKTLCRDYRYGLLWRQLYGVESFNDPSWTPQHIKEDMIICSYGARGTQRLAKEIPHLRRGRSEGTLECVERTKLLYPGRPVELDREVTIHVVESIPRLAELEQELKLRFT
jgi:nucleoside 2-deoxyribosyltransferase